MTCTPATFAGSKATDRPDANWNGDVRFVASTFWEPLPGGTDAASSASPAVVFAAALATAQGQHLTARGSGWAFANLIAPDDQSISLRQLAGRLDYVVDTDANALDETWRKRQFDPDSQRRLVHVEAGIQIGALCEMLDANPGEPLALRTLGGANGQSLAGALSTSTHGGDWQERPFPDMVRAVHLVTTFGRELWIEPVREPITDDARLRAALPCPDTEIVRSNEVFDAVLVGLGRFGVIYSVVLEVRPAFNVAGAITFASREAAVASLRAAVSAPHPIRPFLDMAASTPFSPALRIGDEVMAAGDPTFCQLIFNSQDTTVARVERRWPTARTDELNLPTDCFATPWVIGLGVDWANMDWDAGRSAADALEAAMSIKLASLQTEGARGPHHLMTSGRRSTGRPDPLGESVEIVFDARDPDAAEFLATTLLEAHEFPQAGWISVRPCAPSQATLSMHRFAPDTLLTWSMEFTTIRDAPGAGPWMDEVLKKAAQFGGRPHWGQLNPADPVQVARLYGPRVREWHHALWTVSRDSAVFSSDFTRARGLDPTRWRVVRAVHRDEAGSLTHLVGDAGAPWSPASVHDVIHDLRYGYAMYAVPAGPDLSFVEAVNDPHVGGTYLRTTADGAAANNLANLPLAPGPRPALLDDASFVLHDLPPGAEGGTPVTGHVVMYNTGTSVWHPGRWTLVATQDSGLAIDAAALTQAASPFQEARFEVAFTAGAPGTRATLSWRLAHDGQPFGDESEAFVIVFTDASEPADCVTLRAQIAALEAAIANLEDQLDPEGDPGAQARIRRQILEDQQEIARLTNRASSLGCTLA